MSNTQIAVISRTETIHQRVQAKQHEARLLVLEDLDTLSHELRATRHHLDQIATAGEPYPQALADRLGRLVLYLDGEIMELDRHHAVMMRSLEKDR